MRSLRIIAVVAQLIAVVNAACDTETELTWVELSGAKCADGTPAGYFVNTPEAGNSENALVYLGDGAICGSEEQCTAMCDVETRCADAPPAARYAKLSNFSTVLLDEDDVLDRSAYDCLRAKLECGSSNYIDETLNAETVLCRDDPSFGGFTRVYVPHCTLDWWLGNGATAGAFTFNGNAVLKAVVTELIAQTGLGGGPAAVNPRPGKLVLAGSRGAAVGVLNSAQDISDSFGGLRVLSVLDSPWLLDSRTFASYFTSQTKEPRIEPRDVLFAWLWELETNSRAWIDTAQLDGDCFDVWNSDVDAVDPTSFSQLYRCLSAPELLSRFAASRDVFVVQSQYDLTTLDSFGLNDAVIIAEQNDIISATQSQRESLSALAINSFIETYGQRLRSSMNDAINANRFSTALASVGDPTPTSVGKGRHVWFSSACAQHNLLPPTELQVFVDSAAIPFGNTGRAVVSKTGDEWNQIKIDGVSLRDRLVTWMGETAIIVGPGNTSSHNLYTDTCNTFLCNEKCPTSIEPLELKSNVPLQSECEQLGVMSYAFLVMLVSCATFALAALKVLLFRKRCAQYWNQNGHRQKLKATGSSFFGAMRGGGKNKHDSDGLESDGPAMQGHSPFDIDADRTLSPAPSFAGFGRVAVAKSGTVNNDMSRDAAQDELLQQASANKSRQIQLMVRDLSYWGTGRAKTPRGRSRISVLKNMFTAQRKTQPIQILNKVSLNFAAGRIHAIMGPSGSGKSTLLDLITLSRDKGTVSGQHYINGVPSSLGRALFMRTWLANNLSYVRQQDLLFPHLTVRQHLEHSAWMMLPEFMPANAKLRRVLHVMKLLELESIANSPCGDGGVKFKGGISGGQRRRVSVATRLLAMPGAMMLDEPTSGLDSTNALLLFKSLHNLAHKGGLTVTLTLHQPRREIWDLIDDLSILHRGRVVFSGNIEEVKDHFNIASNEHNVADEVIDKLSGMTDKQVDVLHDKYRHGPLGQRVEAVLDSEQTYLTASMARSLRTLLINHALSEGRWSWNETVSASTLTWMLMSRTFARGGFDVVRTVCLSAFGGLMVGLVFLGTNTYSGRTALLYLAVATMSFLQSTFLGDRYYAEKAMFSYERANGTRVSFWALMLSQFLRNAVTSLLEGVAFAFPVFFMGGLRADGFLTFLVTMMLTSYAFVMQNTLVEIDRIRRGDRGIRTSALINMGLMSMNALFNGFIIRLVDLPVFLRWLPNLMISYWSFSGLMVNEFAGVSLPQANSNPLEKAVRTGDNLLRSFEYDSQGVYLSILVLLGFIAAFHALSLISFYLRNETTRRGKLKLRKGANKQRSDSSASGMATKGKKGTGVANAGTTMQNVFDKSSRHLLGNSDGHLMGTNKSSSMAVKRFKRFSTLTSFVLRFFGTRLALCMFFFVDLFSSLYVCTYTTIPTSADEVAALSFVEFTFVAGTIAIYGAYLAQFIFQMLYLVPRSAEGKRLAFVWISWHDLVGAGFLAVDGALVFILLTLSEASIERQLLFVFLIRLARFARLATYWAKVTNFHYLRAMAFKSKRSRSVVDEEGAGQVDEEGLQKSSSFVNGNGPLGSAAQRVFLRMSMRNKGGHQPTTSISSFAASRADTSSAGGDSSVRRRSQRSGPRAAVFSSKSSFAQIWQRQPGYMPTDNPWADFRQPQTEGAEGGPATREEEEAAWDESSPDLDFDEF